MSHFKAKQAGQTNWPCPACPLMDGPLTLGKAKSEGGAAGPFGLCSLLAPLVHLGVQGAMQTSQGAVTL